MHKFWKDRLKEHSDVIKGISADTELITMMNNAAKVIVQAYRSGGKLLICGNGGSAADSQHIAAELVSRFLIERKALNAESLTINTSSLTAIGNDYSFDQVFSRQVEAKGAKGDVLIGVSTSSTPRIQEAHILIGHILCEFIENELFGEQGKHRKQ